MTPFGLCVLLEDHGDGEFRRDAFCLCVLLEDHGDGCQQAAGSPLALGLRLSEARTSQVAGRRTAGKAQKGADRPINGRLVIAIPSPTVGGRNSRTQGCRRRNAACIPSPLSPYILPSPLIPYISILRAQAQVWAVCFPHGPRWVFGEGRLIFLSFFDIVRFLPC